MDFNAEYNSQEKVLRFDGGMNISGVVLKVDGGTSDGYHKVDELYYHRLILTVALTKVYEDKSWKSWLHHDGTMFDNYFIIGIETPEGQFTYHYHESDWEKFKIKELAFAPEWDGHEAKDVTRLLSLEEIDYD